MSFKVIPTPPFERELKQLAKKYSSLKNDIFNIVQELLINPRIGKSLGGDCYKVRMAISSKGRGKSSGARLITYVQIIDQNIFLIAIYDKSEMASLTEKDIRQRLKRIK